MKIRSLLLTASLGLFLGGNTLQAQTVTFSGCATDEQARKLELQFPGQFPNREALEQQIQTFMNNHAGQQKTTGVVYKIPVVIHVVTTTGCSGISKAQILNGLEVINQDFRKQNPDTVNTRAIFKPYAADTEIEFVLAQRTPNGGYTDGINRVTSLAANAPFNRDDVKTAAPAWPADKYFNIWIVDAIYDQAVNSTVLGYAQFPTIGAWNTYGVVLQHTQWGKQGAVAGTTANSTGHYSSHEISHCLNLLHDFNCGNSSTDHCTTGDRCGDTPPTNLTNVLPCDLTQNTCSNDVGLCSPYLTNVPDQIENFLSSSDCQSMFTQNQKTRMRDAINAIPQLTSLVSATNATVTGIAPGMASGPLDLPPMAYFCASGEMICAGSTVSFTDKTYSGAPVTWTWTFPGGTPATSNLQNPVVTYNTPGEYTVTLVATNPVGASTYIRYGLIKVIATSNLVNIAAPAYFVESFENTVFPNNSQSNRAWSLQTTSLATTPVNWQRVNNAASDGQASMKLQNSAISQGVKSSMITPNFENMSQYLLFDVAYAPKTTTPAEELHIYGSTDCGATWGTPIKTLIGSQLVTNGGTLVSGNFIPSLPEWRTETLPIYTRFPSAGHIMFKIEGVSKNGGNLYVDNFRLGTVLGTKAEQAAQNLVNVYPNPATAETGIHFELKTAEKVTVTILDLAGKTVYAGTETTFSAGSHILPVAGKIAACKAGMYLVQLTVGGKIYNTKLLLQ
jgi:PKD repeat protein